ncbi:zinc-ribbon domain-containing protein, partial [Aminicella lysinilytica]
MYCKKCGHQLSEEDRFCPNCGAKVEERVNMFAENDFVPPFRQTTHDAQ